MKTVMWLVICIGIGWIVFLTLSYTGKDTEAQLVITINDICKGYCIKQGIPEFNGYYDIETGNITCECIDGGAKWQVSY